MSRFQRFLSSSNHTRAVGPGYYIPRLWRSEHASDLIDESSMLLPQFPSGVMRALPSCASFLENGPLLRTRFAFQTKARLDSFVTAGDSGSDIFAHHRSMLETVARAPAH